MGIRLTFRMRGGNSSVALISASLRKKKRAESKFVSAIGKMKALGEKLANRLRKSGGGVQRG